MVMKQSQLVSHLFSYLYCPHPVLPMLSLRICELFHGMSAAANKSSLLRRAIHLRKSVATHHEQPSLPRKNPLLAGEYLPGTQRLRTVSVQTQTTLYREGGARLVKEKRSEGQSSLPQVDYGTVLNGPPPVQSAFRLTSPIALEFCRHCFVYWHEVCALLPVGFEFVAKNVGYFGHDYVDEQIDVLTHIFMIREPV